MKEHFLKTCFKKGILGQSLLEYTLIVGVVSLVFVAMGPSMRRGIQSIVKVTSDGLAVQNQADQVYDPNAGYLVESFSSAKLNSDTAFRELPGGITRRIYNENSERYENALINEGLTEVSK